jgi:hypothetical protein
MSGRQQLDKAVKISFGIPTEVSDLACSSGRQSVHGQINITMNNLPTKANNSLVTGPRRFPKGPVLKDYAIWGIYHLVQVIRRKQASTTERDEGTEIRPGRPHMQLQLRST